MGSGVETAAGQGILSHSLLQDSPSHSMKAKGAFVLKYLAQNRGLGRRRQCDPNSRGRALHRPSAHRGGSSPPTQTLWPWASLFILPYLWISSH